MKLIVYCSILYVLHDFCDILTDTKGETYPPYILGEVKSFSLGKHPQSLIYESCNKLGIMNAVVVGGNWKGSSQMHTVRFPFLVLASLQDERFEPYIKLGLMQGFLLLRVHWKSLEKPVGIYVPFSFFI